MRILYSIAIWFYGAAINIASLFNDKAKKWKDGRKDILSKLEQAFKDNKTPVLWVHCASLGEFEQGRPVTEAYRAKFPTHKILLTFFSPSGYEVRKNYPVADHVFYMPLDSNYNAKKVVEIVKPTIAVFVKYEFWFHYLRALKKNNSAIYIISAKFRADQYFFQWYGGWFRKQLKVYKKIFVQDDNSEKLLKQIKIDNVVIAGDTRFDRVVNIAEQAKPDELIKAFKGENKLWICGSTWEQDEAVIGSVYSRLQESCGKIKLLLVPHEIGEKHIKQVTDKFKAVKYSAATIEQAITTDVMVVDKIGLLSSLYQYGNVAYVGGGFGKSVHNLPEAVVFGIPVVFGPNHKKFNEATDLLKLQAGFTINSEEDMYKIMGRLFRDDDYRKWCGDAARAYIYEGRGATRKIMTELETVTKL